MTRNFGKLNPSEYQKIYIVYFTFCSSIRELEGQREVLKSTVQEADDAETLAHDALASIDARAEEITDRLKITNNLQQKYTEMSFAIGTTKFLFLLVNIFEKKTQCSYLL